MTLRITWDYSQPDFYRFNSDSILLSSAISKYLDSIESEKIDFLDICTGCGVVAVESILKSKYQGKINLELNEVQEEFLPHLKVNLKLLDSKRVNSELSLRSFTEYKKNTIKFDLISCNPPYYHESTHRPSKNINRNICRQFQEQSIDELLEIALSMLSEKGRFFFLLHKDCGLKKTNLSTTFKQFDFIELEKSSNVSVFLAVRLNIE